MKQGAGARKFLTAFADRSPLFVVFRAAQILERRKLALFFKFHLKLCDIEVFRVVQIAQQDPVHHLDDLLRVGFDARLCLAHTWTSNMKISYGTARLRNSNGLGNPLGFHLLQEKRTRGVALALRDSPERIRGFSRRRTCRSRTSPKSRLQRLRLAISDAAAIAENRPSYCGFDSIRRDVFGQFREDRIRIVVVRL